MMDDRIIAALRESAAGRTAVEIVGVLEALAPNGLSHGVVVTFLKRAFPAIPLRTLLEAGAWHRLSASGGLDDEWFNDLLRPWLPPSA